MRVPIAYALYRKKRTKNTFSSLPLEDFGTFHFRKFTYERYPCVYYAREALQKGLTFPTVLNAANEEAVYAFLDKKIAFLDIEKIIKIVLDKHVPNNHLSVEEIVKADKWARLEAQKIIKGDKK